MPDTYSYLHDAKVIRVPSEIKNRLDEAKPSGIENWKFAADIIALGLTTYEQLKKQKHLQGVANYQMADELAASVGGLIAAHAKK